MGHLSVCMTRRRTRIRNWLLPFSTSISHYRHAYNKITNTEQTLDIECKIAYEKGFQGKWPVLSSTGAIGGRTVFILRLKMRHPTERNNEKFRSYANIEPISRFICAGCVGND